MGRVEALDCAKQFADPGAIEVGLDRPVRLLMQQRRKPGGVAQRGLKFGHERADEPALQVAHEFGGPIGAPQVTFRAGGFQHELHMMHEQHPVERLDQERDGAAVEGARDGLGVVMPCDHQDRHVRIAQARAHLVEHVEARDGGHAEVEHDKIKRRLVEGGNGRAAAVEQAHLVAGADQRVFRHLAIERVVIHEQDAASPRRRLADHHLGRLHGVPNAIRCRAEHRGRAVKKA